MNKLMMALSVRATLTVALLCCKATSFAQDQWALCKPIEAVSFSERVHVKCETPVNGVFWYFACSTEDAHFASRMLNLCLAAQVSEKTMSILFDPNDKSGVTFGCQENDCRNLHAIGMTEAAPPIAVPAPSPTPSPLSAHDKCVLECNNRFACENDNPACINARRNCLNNCPH